MTSEPDPRYTIWTLQKFNPPFSIQSIQIFEFSNGIQITLVEYLNTKLNIFKYHWNIIETFEYSNTEKFAPTLTHRHLYEHLPKLSVSQRLTKSSEPSSSNPQFSLQSFKFSVLLDIYQPQTLKSNLFRFEVERQIPASMFETMNGENCIK